MARRSDRVEALPTTTRHHSQSKTPQVLDGHSKLRKQGVNEPDRVVLKLAKAHLLADQRVDQMEQWRTAPKPKRKQNYLPRKNCRIRRQGRGGQPPWGHCENPTNHCGQIWVRVKNRTRHTSKKKTKGGNDDTEQMKRKKKETSGGAAVASLAAGLRSRVLRWVVKGDVERERKEESVFWSFLTHS